MSTKLVISDVGSLLKQIKGGTVELNMSTKVFINNVSTLFSQCNTFKTPQDIKPDTML